MRPQGSPISGHLSYCRDTLYRTGRRESCHLGSLNCFLPTYQIPGVSTTSLPSADVPCLCAPLPCIHRLQEAMAASLAAEEAFKGQGASMMHGSMAGILFVMDQLLLGRDVSLRLA